MSRVKGTEEILQAQAAVAHAIYAERVQAQLEWEKRWLAALRPDVAEREQQMTAEITNTCLNCGTMRVTILTDQEIENEPQIIDAVVLSQQYDMARHLRDVHGAVL